MVSCYPLVLGVRADVILHYDRPVAPAPDPGSQERDRPGRGVRHDLATVMSLAVTGVLTGCRSPTVIWEDTTDLTAADLRSLGVEAGQALPSEPTIRRVLQDLDPTGLNTLLRSWLCTRTGSIEGRTVIAVDGKTMRGARQGQVSAPHLLFALDQATGAVLTQERVADKSNEIPSLPVLLEPLDLDGAVITADAMHTQVDIAEWITQRGGHYLLTPLGKQKTLRRTLKNLPWKSVPSDSGVDTGHGRRVRRRSLRDRGPAPRRSGTWSSTRGPLPSMHRQWPTDRGRLKEPGHPASSGWSMAPPSPSPQPPDPCQDTPWEPSSSLPKLPPKQALPTPRGRGSPMMGAATQPS